MKIAISTNLNGAGLQVDAELLEGFLVAHGHAVTLVQYDQPLPEERFELLIALEVMTPELATLASRVWIFPNCEWLKPEYVRPIQRYCERVFAKTHEAERALRERFSNVHYTGFLTRDKMDARVARERRFLHVGGNGGYRNTPAVIAAWREYRYWIDDGFDAELTVVSNSTQVSFAPTPGITFIKRATDGEITRLQNSHLYHVYPSAYEGFGHALHEGQSVGAIILTTDAAPMNEFGVPFTVPSIGKKKKNFGELHEVGAAAIREQVGEMLRSEDQETMSAQARMDWEASNAAFGEAFLPFLSPAMVSARLKPTIALWGNLEPEHSTENDLVWTLRDMGYPVVTFQENRDTTDEILERCQDEGVRLLIYVHTHGWETPGKITIDEMLVALRSQGVKTASFHLDRYIGLNMLDGRESRVGSHPFWRTDTVFTADGGNQDFFASRSVNHVWLPPAVVKRDCHPSTYDPSLAIDVGFVGAVGYHPEYPFRGQLIEFLKETYGERFRVFSGYRGERLNSLYAAIKVVVGDSCFGGSDFYWSDRVPESCGRGAFLLHPACKGLRIPGLVTFEPGNLEELRDLIDFFLEHEAHRNLCRAAACEWVYHHETYHNRMAELLRKCGVE